MNGASEIRELIAEIRNTYARLERIHGDLHSALRDDIAALGRTGRSALIPTGLLENYYTCLETSMLRISQHFENNLDPSRWHAELLRKMTLRIEGIRVEVFDEPTYRRLVELLKFRHFRRYYYEIEYDWDRIDYLVAILEKAHPAVLDGLTRFIEFLEQVEHE
ncbi:MAG: hypothetical protein ACOC2D_12325 [Spirochaetota bacterium]